jgi:hypothetical protein
MNLALALMVVGALFAFSKRRARPDVKEETETAEDLPDVVPEEIPEEEVPEEDLPDLMEDPETEEAPGVIMPLPGTSEHDPFGSVLPPVNVDPPLVGPVAVSPGVYSILIPGKAYLKLPAPADNFQVLESPDAFQGNLYPADQSPRKMDPFTPFASWNLEVLASEPGVFDVVFRSGAKDVARYVFEVLRP